MKLSIIILTLNNLKYTKQVIQSLYKNTKDFELIIVDNGSTDGTIEYLKKLNDIKLILNTSNVGFSKGNNQGIEVAEGEYIAFLNNDILLSPNWFKECENVFKTTNAAFVSPREINPYVDNANKLNYFTFFEKQKFDKQYQKDFDDCVFSCVVTKKEILDNIGNFSEEFYPAYFEDNEFKYRAIKKGYDIYVANKACFFHYGSKTSFGMNLNFKQNRYLYYNDRHFAEYLTISGEKLMILKHRLKIYNNPLCKSICACYCFGEKFKRRIKSLANRALKLKLF